MKGMLSDRIGRVSNLVLLAAFFVGMAVFFIASPFYGDDMRFSFMFLDWVWGESDSFPWREIWNSIPADFLTDNLRLSNIFVIPFLAFPKWVGGGFISIVLVAGILMMFRILDVRVKTSPLVPVAVMLWVFCPVWIDGMDGLDFQFNYMISFTLSIFLIRSLQLYTKNSMSACWPIFLGLLTGGWHEAFGLSLLTGIFVMCLLKRDWRRPGVYGAMASLIIGLIWIVYGYFFVSHKSVTPSESNVLMNVIVSLAHHRGMALMLLTVLVMLVAGKGRELKKGMMPLWIVSGTVAWIIGIAVGMVARAGWWCDIAGIAVALSCLPILLPRFCKRYRIGNLIVGLAMGIVSIAAVTVADFYMVRNGIAARKAIVDFRRDPSSYLFVDYRISADVPLIAWTVFTQGHYKLDLQYPVTDRYCLGKNYQEVKDHKKFFMLPKALEYVTAHSGEKLKGEREIRRAGKLIYMPVSEAEAEEYAGYGSFERETYMVTYANGSVRQGLFYIVPFTSRGDGRHYVWLAPDARDVVNKFRDVTGVQRVDN